LDSPRCLGNAGTEVEVVTPHMFAAEEVFGWSSLTEQVAGEAAVTNAR